ncbi:MAG: sensor histidine kinase [Phycisphaerales bacterium]
MDESSTAIPDLGARGRSRPGGFLAGMRVRKKLIVLHTIFSLLLAGILAAALLPSITAILEEAELHEAKLALKLVAARVAEARAEAAARGAPADIETIVATATRELPPGVRVARGGVDEFGWPTAMGQLKDAAMVGGAGTGRLADGSIAAWIIDPDEHAARGPGTPSGAAGYVAVARLEGARQAVARLYAIVTIALLVVYGLIAAALELLVLPRHVYQPIRALLKADDAVQSGHDDAGLVPEREMPADELGEIMRSRNRAIRSLRQHERDLAKALSDLASTAGDLRRKNHLLETAQRNLADADRLASLGIMSAGLAHELNTPLAVAKGLVEKLAASPQRRLDEADAALLLRVVGRLERLSESLLDFARVRPPSSRVHRADALLDEAWTLVRLDREARHVEFRPAVPPDVEIACDGDRLVQVLVNLLRNAVDALANEPRPAIDVSASTSQREGRSWVSITVADNGPGIDPEILPRLFEPFASTKLDARGTGLGLAVSEGIIREHGGLLMARNRQRGRGSVFEIVLPVSEAATLESTA